jgi:hypothetical protein
MSLPSEAGFSQQKLENHQQEIRVSRKQRGMAPMIIKFHASKFTCQQQNEEITSQYGIEWIVKGAGSPLYFNHQRLIGALCKFPETQWLDLTWGR